MKQVREEVGGGEQGQEGCGCAQRSGVRAVVSWGLQPPEAACGEAVGAEGPSQVQAGSFAHLRTFLPQSEEKYHCVSDSQCRPERFPGGGECSPPHPVTTPKGQWRPGGQHSPVGELSLGEGGGLACSV